MTVGELIERLQRFEESMKVHFAYDYGDHWHTRVAPEVEEVGEVEVEYSDYHRMPKLVSEDDRIERDRDEDKWKTVIILK
jgi:hypothetical protein